MQPRILVCGGRDFNDYEFIRNSLDKLCFDRGWLFDTEYCMPNIHLIHGAARGADDCADQWGVVNWVPTSVYPAEWDKYGRRAGPLRNIQMLKEGKPDIVVAFPGGRGTEHMKKIAREAGVEVLEIVVAL